MDRAAELSSCGVYRYALTRTWDARRPLINFVGLNPSTADASRDDPTIRRCIGYARSWGFGGIHVTNLYALRATAPGALNDAIDPVGTDNDRWIDACAKQAELILVCWGSHRSGRARSRSVATAISKYGPLYCLRTNRDREPAHPLYLPRSLTPVGWEVLD